MSSKFPVDAPINKVMKALQSIGFAIVREGNHIAMLRKNADGSVTPLTLPNHRTIKGSTLRTICTQSGISREDFLRAYENS
jgi:predicted RNA binding protein YcfA (HicA-like mRNA interferase family)